jgi:hypothetical protein
MERSPRFEYHKRAIAAEKAARAQMEENARRANQPQPKKINKEEVRHFLFCLAVICLFGPVGILILAISQLDCKCK